MPNQNKKLVLIIDDDSMIRKMYSRKFSADKHFKALTAENGRQGLELIKANKPDLILLDVMMPKLDGFAVLEKIKKDVKLKKTPVLLLTNLGHGDDRQAGLSRGAYDYLVKAEYTPSAIVELARKILKI